MVRCKYDVGAQSSLRLPGYVLGKAYMFRSDFKNHCDYNQFQVTQHKIYDFFSVCVCLFYDKNSFFCG